MEVFDKLNITSNHIGGGVKSVENDLLVIGDDYKTYITLLVDKNIYVHAIHKDCPKIYKKLSIYLHGKQPEEVNEILSQSFVRRLAGSKNGTIFLFKFFAQYSIISKLHPHIHSQLIQSDKKAYLEIILNNPEMLTKIQNSTWGSHYREIKYLLKKEGYSYEKLPRTTYKTMMARTLTTNGF